MSVSLSSLDLISEYFRPSTIIHYRTHSLELPPRAFISVSLSGPTALDISEHTEHAEETTIAHDAISGFGRAIHAGPPGCLENLPDGTKRLSRPPKAYE
jgi:hypothetical protein